MHGNVVDLAECTEYHKVMNSRVPLAHHAIFGLLLGLLVATTTWSALTQANVVIRGAGRMRPITDESGIESVSEQLSTERAGRIAAVQIKQNDLVRRGQLIARLDTRQLDHQIAGLRAELGVSLRRVEQATQHLELLEAEFAAASKHAAAELAEARQLLVIEQAVRTAKLKSADSRLAAEREKHERLCTLASRNFVSQQEVTESRVALSAADQELTQLRLPLATERIQVLEGALDSLQSSHATKLHVAHDDLQARHAEVAEKQLKIKGLEDELRQSRILSPMEGVITATSISAGDVVQPGPIGITIMPHRELEMVMSVAAADVGALHEGMPVRIKMDAFDYQDYGAMAGTIRLISPDSLVEESSANGIGQAVYLVRVKVFHSVLEHAGKKAELKLGMTGVGEIISERRPLLGLLLRKLKHSITL